MADKKRTTVADQTQYDARKNIKCLKTVRKLAPVKTCFTFETVASKDKDHIYHLLVNQPKSMTNHEIQTWQLMRQVDNPPSKII